MQLMQICKCFLNNLRHSRQYTNRVRSYENMIGSKKDTNLTVIDITNEVIVSIPLESILNIKRH